MQYSPNTRTRLTFSVSSILSLALLAFSGPSLYAQNAGSATRQDAADRLVPVNLWVGGRTVPLKVSPLTDTTETYIPLPALAAVNSYYRLKSGGTIAHIWGPANQEQNIPVYHLRGNDMLPLSVLARMLNASIETSSPEPDAKPTFRSPDTVYLLAQVTDARFENGALHVRTSFPVPFHTRMLAETKPVRGYVDCVGAKVSESFQPAPLADTEKQILRIRAGQTSPSIARIVVELADGVSLRAADTLTGPLEIAVNAIGWSGVRSTAAASSPSQVGSRSTPGVVTDNHAFGGNGKGSSPENSLTPPVPAPDQGDRNPRANTTVNQNSSGPAGTTTGVSPGAAAAGSDRMVDAKPSRGGVDRQPGVPPPTEVRGFDFISDSPSVMHFNVVTSGRVRPIVRYSPGTTQMLVDIPNAVLSLSEAQEAERSLAHPLISGARIETVLGAKAPTTRLTLDTARILGYALNIQQGSFSLELRVPRNASGVLADKMIVVDAGHGGSATGATCAGILEKDCTLAIALQLRAELEACGARVIMTRTRDMDVSLTDRARMGNEIGADLFVSIHNDSNGRNNSASGTSTYYHNSDPSSRALATCVQHAVMSITGLPSRGVLSDTVMYNSGFAVLRGSSMPAVLCEVAYINNTTDRRKLVDSQFQQRVARAICDGLRNYVEGTPRRAQPAFARPGRSGSSMSPDTNTSESDSSGN